MLDSTKSKRPVFEVEKRSIAPEPWRDGIGFRIYLAKISQLKLMIVSLMFVGGSCLLPDQNSRVYRFFRTVNFEYDAAAVRAGRGRYADSCREHVDPERNRNVEI